MGVTIKGYPTATGGSAYATSQASACDLGTVSAGGSTVASIYWQNISASDLDGGAAKFISAGGLVSTAYGTANDSYANWLWEGASAGERTSDITANASTTSGWATEFKDPWTGVGSEGGTRVLLGVVASPSASANAGNISGAVQWTGTYDN